MYRPQVDTPEATREDWKSLVSEKKRRMYRVPGVTHDLVAWCDLTPHLSVVLSSENFMTHWNRFLKRPTLVLGRRWEPTHDAHNSFTTTTMPTEQFHHYPRPPRPDSTPTSRPHFFPRSYRTSLLRGHLQGQGVLRRQHEVGHPHQRVRASGKHFHGFSGALEVESDAESHIFFSGRVAIIWWGGKRAQRGGVGMETKCMT